MKFGQGDEEIEYVLPDKQKKAIPMWAHWYGF